MAHGLNSLIKREIECNQHIMSSTSSSTAQSHHILTMGGVGTNKSILTDLDSLRRTPPTMQSSASVVLNHNSTIAPVVVVNAAPPTKMGSRRIFTPQFKLQVLDSYRNDSDCKGNQRATARKYGIHRRQIQKWLQCEDNLRSSVLNNGGNNVSTGSSTNTSMNSSSSSSSNNNNNSSTNNNNNNNNGVITKNMSIISNNHGNNELMRLTTHTTTGFVSPPMISYHHHHHNPQHHSQLHSETSVNIISPASLPNSPVPSSATYSTPSATLSPLCYPSSLEYGSYESGVHLQTYPQQRYDYQNFYEVDPSAPIDLSLQKPKENESEHDSKVCGAGEWKNSVKTLTELTPVVKSEAWDLSCRKRKTSDPSDESNLPSPPKAVKLFKPYLLGDDDDTSSEKSKKDDKPESPEQQNDPIIWSNHLPRSPQSTSYESGSGGGGSSSTSSGIYQHEYNFFPSPTYPTTSPAGYELTTYWCPQGSPVSGYESAASVSSTFSDHSDHHYNNPPPHYAFDHSATSKFHYRRDIQKWLQNDDHFRPLVISN